MEKILSMCHDEGIEYIAWQGGEPTLHSKLYEIIQMHKAYGIKAMIFSNGVIDPQIICNVKDIVQSILINCNAPHTYEKDELQQLFSNITLMKELYGEEKVAIGINIYSNEMNTSFILDYAKQLHIQEVRVDVTRPAPSKENAFIDFSEVGKTFTKALELVKLLYANGIKKVHFDCPFPLCSLTEEDRRFLWSFMYDNLKSGQCKTYLDITTNANIASCFCSLPFRDVSIESFGSLTHAWQFIKFLEDEIRWNKYTKDSCVTCELSKNQICQGGCLGYKITEDQLIDQNFLNKNRDLIHKLEAIANIYINFHTGNYEIAYETCKNLKNEELGARLVEKLFLYNSICLKNDAELLNSISNYLKKSYHPSTEAWEFVIMLNNNHFEQLAIEVAKIGIEMETKQIYNTYRLHEFLFLAYKDMGDINSSNRALFDYYRMAPIAIKQNMLTKV
jgi:radical SAM protein with 4Fe4S-binding SPASM domain